MNNNTAALSPLIGEMAEGQRGFFEAIDDCNPNVLNRTITVIKGEGFGEKAVLSGDDAAWLSDNQGFIAKNLDKLKDFKSTGVFKLENSLIYVELIGTEKKIVICGAGHVSMPIIKLAKLIGCHATVIDDRPVFAENGRKAGADVVICDEFEAALEKISGDADTYFVIVTRGHQYDSECLRMILNKKYAYVGMMGSSRRVKIVKEQLIKEDYDAEAVNCVHSPIGLKIGAETPEEIAVSIMAEIIQVKNQKKDTLYPPEILRDILGTEHVTPLSGHKALFTIVDKKGAAPREVGTKMIYTSEGKSIGTIGGGCTEAEVMRKAREMFAELASTLASPLGASTQQFALKNRRPEMAEGRKGQELVLMRVDLTADEASLEGEVCGGVIDVLIEIIA